MGVGGEEESITAARANMLRVPPARAERRPPRVASRKRPDPDGNCKLEAAPSSPGSGLARLASEIKDENFH